MISKPIIKKELFIKPQKTQESPKITNKIKPIQILMETIDIDNIENISEIELIENENENETQSQEDSVVNWTGPNLETLSQWIQISSLQIEVMDLAIKHYRSIVRKNVLLGLVFSTASGSISISQMNPGFQNIVYNIIFTVLSFTIAIFTGLIKIYQVQERLEEFIQLKQEWIGFSVVITTEIQLPVKKRKLALDLITKNKNKYLELLKRDVDIPNSIKGRAYKNLYHDKEHFLNNLKKFKKLKEIWACTDDKYFLKLAIALEKDDTILVKDEVKECSWDTCLCICSDNIYKNTIELYKYCFNNKDRYIGEKTALSNIILTVIMEEENEQRNHKITDLLNLIRQRRKELEEQQAQFDAKKKQYGLQSAKSEANLDSIV
jgi:hypothetical protein